MFEPTSRYEGVPEAVYEAADGRPIPYKLLRLAPELPAIQGVAVAPGDRLDLLAFRLYGDPTQYWRLCDANRALWPPDLVAEPGRRLLVPPAVR
jgi:hypothetical protein